MLRDFCTSSSQLESPLRRFVREGHVLILLLCFAGLDAATVFGTEKQYDGSFCPPLSAKKQFLGRARQPFLPLIVLDLLNASYCPPLLPLLIIKARGKVSMVDGKNV
jgi:hypothetical protein